VVATSEDASRENPRRKRLCDIIKGYKNWRALGNGFVECGKRIPVLVRPGFAATGVSRKRR
jgi:hypothetical protein